ARAGNTSLYDLMAPTQVLGGNGGIVGLKTGLRLMADMANKTVQYYGTTDASQIGPATLLSWDTKDATGCTWCGNSDAYWDFSSMAANLYYKDPAIRTAMIRNLLSGNTSNG